MSPRLAPGAGHGLPEPLQLTEPRRSFAPVLAAIVAAMIFQLSASRR